MSANASVEGPSSRANSLNNSGKGKQLSAPNRATPRSSLSQQDENAQRETPVPRRHDDSLTSSSRSVQSPASFDFSKIDRLEESINAPGIVRSSVSNISQQGSPTLPDEKGFSLQIGAELFKLSGASIMSDAPSYLSAFFIEQLQENEDSTGVVRTLYIDRDPETFRDIARHLQGYLITPDDGRHFVKLFADAQFYRLPRLQAQLFDSEIFVEVGNEHFRIPRDIFSAPGDTPNYFTLGFTVFFSSPGDAFPGLNPHGLLRPPAIHPPRIPNRSALIFSDILHMLRGYVLTIKDEDHRNQLLKDARYYNLRGLEQKLIPHEITYSLENRVSEIVIRLQDIKPSQISAVYDKHPSSSQPGPTKGRAGYVHYARPFISEPHHALILEISASTTTEPILLDLTNMRMTVFGNTRSRITTLFQTIANKLNLPTTVPLGLMMAEKAADDRGKGPGTTGLSEDKIKADVRANAHVVIDGKEFEGDNASALFEDIEAPEMEDDHDMAELFADWPSEILQEDATASTKRPLGSPSEVQPGKRRKREDGIGGGGGGGGGGAIWTVHKSQWRLRLQSRSHGDSNGEEGDGMEKVGMEIVMVAVKIEATSGEKARNSQRRFLS